MTAIDQSGQVYWTFEELDIDGAIEIIRSEIAELKEQVKNLGTVEAGHMWRRIVSRNMVINRLEIIRNWEDNSFE